jgi:hypothetical protein
MSNADAQRLLLNRRRLTKEQQARLDAVNAAIDRRDAPPVSLRIVTDRSTGSTLDLLKAPSFRKKRSNPNDADEQQPVSGDDLKNKKNPGSGVADSGSGDRPPVKRMLRLTPAYVRKLQEADDDRRRVAAVLGGKEKKDKEKSLPQPPISTKK